MPYLSHNYRYQPKPKLKNFLESALFILFSAFAIFGVLLILGWFTALAAEALAGSNMPPLLILKS